MKKMMLSLLLLVFSLSLMAQLDKNNWLVGGSGSFSSTNNNFQSTTVESDYKVTDVRIFPTIGYFIVDKLAVGLKSSFSWRKDKGVSANAGNSKDIRIDYGPFVRYYCLNKEKLFNILAELSYQYGNVKYITDDKGVRNNFSVLAGPVLYFNSSVGIDLLLGYKIEKEKITTSVSTPQYFYTDTRKGLQASIGLQIHLEKL